MSLAPKLASIAPPLDVRRGPFPRPGIGIVCSYYGEPWNEGEKNIARALEIGLPQHGFVPHVYANPAHDISAPVRHRPSPGKIASSIRFWRAAGLAARRDGVRAVHLVTSISSVLGLKCAILKAAARAPLVLHATGLSQPLLGHRLLLNADRVIIGGRYLEAWLPDGIDLPPVSPHMNLRAVGRPPTGPAHRFLWLGSMEPVRGVHTLIDALGVLRQRGQLNGTRLTLAWNGLGHESYAGQLRRQIESHGLSDVVRWEGIKTELGHLYETHDVVVIPRAASERMGFPLRLLEAFSYAKPVVTSDVGEMPAVVDGCGLVFRREDPIGLAGAIHSLSTNAPLYEGCARRAALRATELGAAPTIARIAALYRELIAEQGPRRATRHAD